MKRSYLAVRAQRGFTLIEILVATTLTLLMMAMVVNIFALVSENVSGSRSTIQMTDRLRAVADQVQMDLEGLTVTVAPPRDPARDEGYFEYIEGPIGPVIPGFSVAYSDRDDLNNQTMQPPRDTYLDPDTTVGDIDDVLMFTSRSVGAPYVGRSLDEPIMSDTAEICYFLRGRTLYRRVLLVIPKADEMITRQMINNGIVPFSTRPSANPVDVRCNTGFYNFYDLSVHQEGGVFDRRVPVTGSPNFERLVPNTLGDLTKREYRYGHQPYCFPHDARFWGRLGLPTLAECSHSVDSSPPSGVQQPAGSKEYTWPFPWQRTDVTSVTGSIPHHQNAQSVVYQNFAGLNGTQFNLQGRQRLIIPTRTRFDNGNGGNQGLALNDFNPDAAGAAYCTADHERGVFVDLTEQPGMYPPTAGTAPPPLDLWRRPFPYRSSAIAGVDLFPTNGTLWAYFGTPGVNPTYVGDNERINDDVFLTNVLSFDVKAWDPGAPVFAAAPNALPGTVSNAVAVLPGDPGYLLNFAATGATPTAFGAYVDLNYLCRTDTDNDRFSNHAYFSNSPFAGPGNLRSLLTGLRPIAPPVNDLPTNPQSWLRPLVGADRLAAVYDTWSTHYESDGADQDGDCSATPLAGQLWEGVDEGSNGLDDDGDGLIDEPDQDQNGNGVIDTPAELNGEKETAPPYATPLRGIQIKIRVFQPVTRQIREITIVEEFADR